MLLLDAPDAKSFFSRRIALMPLEAASSSIAEPTTPPPITSKSNSLFCSKRLICNFLEKFINQGVAFLPYSVLEVH